MLQIERHKKIMEYVYAHNFVSIEELMDQLHISRSTVRRDIIELEAMNKLSRTRGGVMSYQAATSMVGDIHERKNVNHEEKCRIGEAARQFVCENDKIMLDEGTTTLELARQLGGFSHLDVLTYDLNHVEVLGPMSNVNLIVSCGVYNPKGNNLLGYLAEKFFSEIRADKFFLAADAVNTRYGCMCGTEREIRLKRTMLKACRETILLTDHTKFEGVEFIKVCDLSEIDVIITGKELNPEIYEKLTGLGIEVVLA